MHDLKEKDLERDLERGDLKSAGSDTTVTTFGDSKEQAPQAPQAPQIPNGGIIAWLQVVGVFFLYFNTWGIISSYGPFQAIYQLSILKDQSTFVISTIGSIQSFLMVFMGFIVGPIYDAGYFRHLLISGSVLITLGTFLQSLGSKYWHFLLAQGVCIGIGGGCLIILSVAITSLWFSTKLPLVNGIAASGSGVGGIILPIIFRTMEPKIGFGWSVRIIGIIVASTLLLANLVLRLPPYKKNNKSTERRSFIDKATLFDTPYILFVFGCFVVFLGMYSPFVYVSTFIAAQEHGSFHPSQFVVAIMNSSSIIGRIIPNFFAQALGPMNMIIMSTVALAISVFSLLGIKDNLAVSMVVVVIYGFFTGTFFALQPTIFVRLTEDKRSMGTRFGMAFSVMSFALLSGPPVTGIWMRDGGFNGAWVWVGFVLLVGGGFIGTARVRAGQWSLERL